VSRPTMPDVAREAGVSVKTVSRVINREPGVRPKTEALVIAAIAKLGFRRNDAARSLRSGRSTSSIGLVIEDLGNPFYSTLARAVEGVARSHDSLLISASSEGDLDLERRLVHEMCERRVDGLIIVPSVGDQAFVNEEMEMGTPTVFVDRPPTGVKADVVLADNAGGARAALEFLIARGHESIAILAEDDRIYTMGQRLRAARAAADRAGVELVVATGLRTPAAAAAAVAGILARRRPPTAIFALNNRTAVGALSQVVGRAGSIDVVGFDEFELAHLVPEMSAVVAHDAAALGTQAAELLFARIGGYAVKPKRVVIPTTLVPCDAPQDEHTATARVLAGH
jgi:LacI family transcriptional regulator